MNGIRKVLILVILASVGIIRFLPNWRTCPFILTANVIRAFETDAQVQELDGLMEEVWLYRNALKDELSELEKKLKAVWERVKEWIGSVFDDIMYLLSMTDDTLQILWRNYQDMKKAGFIGDDKYFHAKAQAEAAQLGELSERKAKLVADLREIFDKYKNIYFRKMSVEKMLEDRAQDEAANQYGRDTGQRNPNTPARKLVDIFRPKGLPIKY